MKNNAGCSVLAKKAPYICIGILLNSNMSLCSSTLNFYVRSYSCGCLCLSDSVSINL